MALTAKKALAIANQYTDDTVIGGGAIKGKNCTIDSIEPISGGQRVTFKWTLDDGTEQTTTMDVMDGQDGKGIKSVAINEESHLIITYTDDTTYDAGAIEVHSAVDSVNGKTGEVTLTASDVGALPDDTAIPSKTSDLTNDSNFVADASYVHTDNNYDATAKDIVDGVTTALAGKVDKETGKSLIDLTTVVDGASYDSANHLILFKNGTTTLFSLDAAAFVKDGMVDTVTITGGNLVITFNTDAGKQDISIPLTDIFNPANYYTKTATDGLLADKADKVTSAVSGNFAGLDGNGNLTDSGKKASDFGVYRYQKKINNTASQSTNPKYIELSGVYSEQFVSNTLRVSLGANEVVDVIVSTSIQSQPQIPKVIRYHTPNTPKLNRVWYNLTTKKIVLEIGQYTWAQIDHISGIPTTITDQIVQSVEGYTAVDENSIVYTIPSPTADNLVAMDVNGNLADSGVSKDVIPSDASANNKLVTASDITPEGTQKTTHKNYTNIASTAIFDTSGILTKTPTELINALKDKGYVNATSGYTQIRCTINMVNSNTDKIIISDGTHSIDLVNGWIEFEGAFISGTSAYGSEERWVMKLYNVSSGQMALVTKRAGTSTEPIMKSVTLT